MRTIIRIIVALLVVVVVFWLLFALVRRALPSNIGGTGPSPTPTPNASANAENREFTFTVDGPVVANENFRSSTIYITPNVRTFTAYATYTNEVLYTQSFDNNIQAFTEFLNAFQTLGLVTPTASPAPPGATCPTGRVFNYVLTQPGQTVLDAWSSTCGPTSVSASSNPTGGSTSTVNLLIKAQIPGLLQMPAYTQFQF